MKIFGFILAFYILFLSVQPGLKNVTNLTGTKTETCSCGSSCEPIEKKESEQPSNKKEDSNNKACNPFQPCQCCIVFNNDFVFLTSSPVFILAKQQTRIAEKIPPQIALDFWQPPKIADQHI